MKDQQSRKLATPQNTQSPVKISFRLNNGVKLENRVKSAKNESNAGADAYGDSFNSNKHYKAAEKTNRAP